MNLDPKDKRSLSDARMTKAKEFLADARATHYSPFQTDRCGLW